jgi:hypothetical protein
VPYIEMTTWVGVAGSAVAVASVVARAMIASDTQKKLAAIEKGDETAMQIVLGAAESYHIDTTNLTKEQKFELIKIQLMSHRKKSERRFELVIKFTGTFAVAGFVGTSFLLGQRDGDTTPHPIPVADAGSFIDPMPHHHSDASIGPCPGSPTGTIPITASALSSLLGCSIAASKAPPSKRELQELLCNESLNGTGVRCIESHESKAWAIWDGPDRLADCVCASPSPIAVASTSKVPTPVTGLPPVAPCAGGPPDVTFMMPASVAALRDGCKKAKSAGGGDDAGTCQDTISGPAGHCVQLNANGGWGVWRGSRKIGDCLCDSGSPIATPTPKPHGSAEYTATGLWTAPDGVTTVTAMAIGGGGGGGGNWGGKDGCVGAGGELRTVTFAVEANESLTLNVGAGGASGGACNVEEHGNCVKGSGTYGLPGGGTRVVRTRTGETLVTSAGGPGGDSSPSRGCTNNPACPRTTFGCGGSGNPGGPDGKGQPGTGGFVLLSW